MSKDSIFNKIINLFSEEKKTISENIDPVEDRDDENTEEKKIKNENGNNEEAKENDSESEEEKENGEDEEDKKSDDEDELEGEKKEDLSTQISEIKNIIGHVIQPEERTLSNYINPKFWFQKREKYIEIKKKEREDLNIYEVLSQGARPTIEYYVLTTLSAVIATAGLIIDSSATIIGAMIVAPLMTPILAFSLGVVWGDLKLINISVVSIFKGVLGALGVSALIAFVIPLPGYSNEILSRTHPNLFDILIAIASGIVGAYGYANKKISNSIIGIAIAVALMPPLCIIGIGIGTFNMKIVSGATVLFVINLVSISLAGSIIFWGMKIHPAFADESDVKKRALSQIIISVFILLAISIPIGIFMYNGYQKSETEERARTVIKRDFNEYSIFKMKMEKLHHGYVLKIVLTGESIPDSNGTKTISEKIKKQNSMIKKIKIRFIKSTPLLE